MNTKTVITGIPGCIGHILYENLKDRWEISRLTRTTLAAKGRNQKAITWYANSLRLPVHISSFVLVFSSNDKFM